MDVGAFVETLNKVVTDMDWTSSGSYVTVAVVVGIALMLYTSLGSFTPATKRRAAITSNRVFSSNIALLVCWVVAGLGVVAVGVAAGTVEAATYAFIGVAVYFANTMLLGGSAFLGQATWCGATMLTLHLADTAMGLSDMLWIYTIFVVSITLSFPPLAIVFSPLTSNLIVSCVLGAILHVTAGATTLQAGMVAVGLLAVLQSVTSQRYTGAGFALMPTLLLFVTGLLSVTLAIATPTRNIFALSALVVAILVIFAKLAHGNRPVFAGYDHHNARATVVSVATFVIVVRAIVASASSDSLAAVRVASLLHVTVGYAFAAAFVAAAFHLAERWRPEDSHAWRLVILDLLLLVPYLLVPLGVTVSVSGITWRLRALLASYKVNQFGLVLFFDSQSPLVQSFFGIILVRIAAELCQYAVSCVSLLFVPLLANTAQRGSPRSRVSALTFNGGPHPDTTPDLLDVLAEHQASATFFITYQSASRYPDLVQKIYDDGHDIGVLGTSQFDALGSAAAEAVRTARLVAELTGEQPTWFRPCITGARSAVALQAVASCGFSIAMWNVNPWDWVGSPNAVARRVAKEIEVAGSVVLLHEVAPRSATDDGSAEVQTDVADTTDALLDSLAEAGMEAVALDTACRSSLETLP